MINGAQLAKLNPMQMAVLAVITGVFSLIAFKIMFSSFEKNFPLFASFLKARESKIFFENAAAIFGLSLGILALASLFLLILGSFEAFQWWQLLLATYVGVVSALFWQVQSRVKKKK